MKMIVGLAAVVALVVLVMIAFLFVADCLRVSTPTPTVATSAATQHDAFLEKYLTAIHYTYYLNSSLSVKAWELTWINTTSARLQVTVKDAFTNNTWAHDITYVVFPTSRDATNYLNAMNLTAYSLASTEYPSQGPYTDVTGHPPQIYKLYTWYEGNPSNISEYKYHDIAQIDNLIHVDTAKRL